MNEVTYKGRSGKESWTLPLNYRNWHREENGKDVMLVRVAAIDLPIQLTMQIKTDGSVVLARTEFVTHSNTYWHYSQGPHHYEDCERIDDPLTEAQERTIAMLWSENFDRIPSIDPLLPRELAGGIGATAQERMSRSVIEILKSEGLEIPAIA